MSKVKLFHLMGCITFCFTTGLMQVVPQYMHMYMIENALPAGMATFSFVDTQHYEYDFSCLSRREEEEKVERAL